MGEEANKPNDDSGSPEDKKPDGSDTGASDSVDLSKVTLENFKTLLDRDDIKEALLGSESVRREIQSQKDKELARDNRKRFEDDRARVNADTARLDAEEKAQLIKDGDGDALLKREATKLAKDKLDSDANSRVGRIIEDTLRTSPEFSSLGEDKIAEIYSEISRTGGNVVDFTTALSKEKTSQAVKVATADLATDMDSKIKEAVEAQLADAGVKKRSDAASDGDGPSKGISDDTLNRANIKLDSEEDISLAYGNGDIDGKEFEARIKKFREKDY